MRRDFCDRCDAELTNTVSGHVIGIANADEDGNGEHTHEADLCARCYSRFHAWLTAPKQLQSATEALTAAGELPPGGAP